MSWTRQHWMDRWESEEEARREADAPIRWIAVKTGIGDDLVILLLD